MSRDDEGGLHEQVQTLRAQDLGRTCLDVELVRSDVLRKRVCRCVEKKSMQQGCRIMREKKLPAV